MRSVAIARAVLGRLLRTSVSNLPARRLAHASLVEAAVSKSLHRLHGLELLDLGLQLGILVPQIHNLGFHPGPLQEILSVNLSLSLVVTSGRRFLIAQIGQLILQIPDVHLELTCTSLFSLILAPPSVCRFARAPQLN